MNPYTRFVFFLAAAAALESCQGSSAAPLPTAASSSASSAPLAAAPEASAPVPEAAAPIASAAPATSAAESASAVAAPAPSSSPSSGAASGPPPRCAEGCKTPAAAYASLFPGTRANPCTKPSRKFPSLLPAGRFTPNFGCEPQGVIEDCCLVTPNVAAARELAGWPSMSTAAREAQALAWTREIIFPFETILEKAPHEFTDRDHAFSPPLSQSNPDGGVTVRVWLRERAGPSKHVVFTAQLVKFSAAGIIEKIIQTSQWAR